MFFIVYILFFPFCFVHPCFMSHYMYLLVTPNPIPHIHIIRIYNKLLIYLSIYNNEQDNSLNISLILYNYCVEYVYDIKLIK